ARLVEVVFEECPEYYPIPTFLCQELLATIICIEIALTGLLDKMALSLWIDGISEPSLNPLDMRLVKDANRSDSGTIKRIDHQESFAKQHMGIKKFHTNCHKKKTL
ncbi:hypothetical protein KI387_001205, partial [Taxus chinensis]